MSISEIQARIREFRDARDWMQFHNPKDMAAALAIEAAELQEIFLWKTGDEIPAVAAQKQEHLREEIADISLYLFELADNLGIDLPAAIIAKMEKNAAKYPVEKARGSSAKYNEL